ncbi:MAG TPA: chromate resistance protein ChrB domain-containing protein [Candidatus Nitrosocosmicus sp.]|nr:chromate resistance protein ChrB domain-containing protein [Candidatus Nitrosocosmicus sp.]
MKTIVTHVSPDVDALSSVWLIRKFKRGWENADIAFISQGTTYEDEPVDSDPNVIHVDTGLGKLDHHQNNEDTCAAKKVFEYLRNDGEIKEKFIPTLERMVHIINDIDHFREIFWAEPDSDIYEFSIVSIIEGMKVRIQNDHELAMASEKIFDGILQSFFNKIQAEKEIDSGLIFKSLWGKTLAINSENDEVGQLAQKKGFHMVIRKSLKKGHLKIKLHPILKKNLKKIEKILKKEDPKATWFYHQSGHMLISGSSKSPTSIPTKLPLNRIVEIIKNIQK